MIPPGSRSLAEPPVFAYNDNLEKQVEQEKEKWKEGRWNDPWTRHLGDVSVEEDLLETHTDARRSGIRRRGSAAAGLHGVGGRHEASNWRKSNDVSGEFNTVSWKEIGCGWEEVEEERWAAAGRVGIREADDEESHRHWMTILRGLVREVEKGSHRRSGVKRGESGWEDADGA